MSLLILFSAFTGNRPATLALKNDIRTLYGTLKKARHADPARYSEHEAVVKELTRVRAIYRRKRKVEFREDCFDTMPSIEIDKQIDQLLGKSSDVDSTDTTTDTWDQNTPLWNVHGSRTPFSALKRN
jgi:hypothetical protein